MYDLGKCDCWAQFQGKNPKYTNHFQNPKVKEMQKNAGIFSVFPSPTDPKSL